MSLRFPTLPFGAVLTAALLIGGVAPAAAQQPSEEEVEQFRRHVADGVEHYKSGEFYASLEDFRHAEEIANPPSLQYKTARAYQAVGNCSRARETYEAYLSNNLPDEKAKKGEKRLRELGENCPRRGTLKVTCAPDGVEATLRVAGREGPCPAKLALEPGSHQIEARAADHPTASKTVEVVAGETSEVQIDLAPEESRGGVEEPRVDSDTSESEGLAKTRYAQIGGITAGVGLLTAGVVTDLSTNRRLEAMAEAEAEGDRREIDRLREQGRSATTRAAIFYATGGALTLGSATWLLLETTGGSASNSRQFEFSISPVGVQGSLRW